jgi:putative iron-dependent peroxidase
MRPQPGIFALGASEHSYVELDRDPSAPAEQLVRALAALSGPETTTGGMSTVIGLRPELWAALRPDDAPDGVRSFAPVRGPELTMPATQHDAWLWIAGGARDAVFDATVHATRALSGIASVASEIGGWIYRNDRDLTGFIDGTENPSMIEAGAVAVRASGPGTGSSIVLVQKWRHEPSFALLSDAEQERVIGRTKPDSIELGEDEMPPDSHVSRNVVEEGGRELRIYRRNTAYGGPTEHGTLFVGFCSDQRPLQVMLERMAGVGDGVRDALTRHTTPLSGAYYVVPALDALARYVELD